MDIIPANTEEDPTQTQHYLRFVDQWVVREGEAVVAIFENIVRSEKGSFCRPFEVLDRAVRESKDYGNLNIHDSVQSLDDPPFRGRVTFD